MVPILALVKTGTVSVLFVDPFAGGVAGFGAKLHEVFAGNPEQDNVTVALKLLIDVIVQVLVFDFPQATLNADGVHEMLKSPGGGAPVVKLKAEA